MKRDHINHFIDKVTRYSLILILVTLNMNIYARVSIKNGTPCLVPTRDVVIGNNTNTNANDLFGETGLEGEYGNLHYQFTQTEENPMWIELVQDKSHSKLQEIIIPGELVISRFGFYDPDRPAIVEKIGDSAFEDSQFKYISIPGTVRRIGKNSFSYTQLEKIEFSEGLISIGEKAFEYNPLLRSIKLPESLKVIEYAAFISCEALEEVDLPSSLIMLGGFTFRYCGEINKIYCHAKNPPIADDSDFGIVHNDNYFQLECKGGPDLDECILYVPSGSEDLYRNAPGWKNFKNILAIEDANTKIEEVSANDNTFLYYINENVLTIPCQPNDIVKVYDVSGNCLDNTTISSPRDYRFYGKGIHIVSLNNKSIKISL